MSPLPSIVTNDGGYHATRLFLMLPPLVLAIAAGILSFINMFKTQLLKSSVNTLVLCVISINFIWVGHYYFKHYVPDSWRWWHVGFKNAMLDVAKIQGDYSRVFINNSYEPSLIRYLFYTSYSPSKFQRLFTIDQPQKEIVPGYDGFTIDGKVFFGTFSSSQKILFPGSLYVVSQRDDVGGDWDWRTSPPSEVKVLSTSTNSFNQPILYLITKK
jgi:hypothetical protein